MSELMLANWADCKLGDIASIIRGVTFPASSKVYEPADGYVACLRTSHVQEKLLWESIYYIPENYVKRADQLVGKNDILMSMANSSNLVGKVCINETDRTACFGAFLSAIRSKEIDNRYVYYYLKSSEAQRALKASASQTVNIANISVGALENLRVPLPPLAEQTRIAAKLDELLAQVSTLKARIDGIPTLLKRFRQSVLAAAVSGQLTEEWRLQQPDRLGKWTKSQIGEVAFVTKLAGFEYTKFVKYKPGGDLKVIKAENAGKNGFKHTEFSTVYSEDVASLSRSKLFGGELLMVFVGAGTGQVALVPNDGNWFLGPNIAMIKPNNKIVSSKYLEHCCRSPIGLVEIFKFMKSTAQPSLSMKTIRQIAFPLPPLSEQTEIVRRVEQLFAFADQLEARVKAAQACIDRLTQSILAEAFRGELVPQDPNDEPASVLLERIKAQRAAEPKAKRGRKASA